MESTSTLPACIHKQLHILAYVTGRQAQRDIINNVDKMTELFFKALRKQHVTAIKGVSCNMLDLIDSSLRFDSAQRDIRYR